MTIACALAAVALALASCTSTTPVPTITAQSPTSAVTPAPSPTPAALVLDPDGSAADNLALFTTVADAVWTSPQRAEGRAYVDALVAAGFDKGAIQVTRDQSTVGNPAESIQFSVLWGSDCLIGQIGPATGEPFTTIAPQVVGGMCLVGQTRPIDW